MLTASNKFFFGYWFKPQGFALMLPMLHNLTDCRSKDKGHVLRSEASKQLWWAKKHEGKYYMFLALSFDNIVYQT